MSDYLQAASPVPAPPPNTPFYKRAWFAAVVAGVLGVGIGAAAAGGGGDAESNAVAAPAPTVTVTVQVEGQPPAGEPVDEPPSEEPSEEPTSEEPPASTNPVFGETFSYDDGLTVTVSAPAPFEPSEFSTVEGAAAYVGFDLTIVNGTAENFDPALFTTTLQSGNTEAEAVFDFENGFEGSPSTTVLPGREVTFKIGYAVADPADLVLEVSPDFERDNVIFTS